MSWTLTARWIFPVSSPPLERGTVTIAGERIEAVEPRGKRTADYDLGNVAILPGFVNAHTHLDLTGLRGKCPPSEDFTDWLRAVIRHRRNQTPEQVEADIRAGLDESRGFGTTLVGDIAAQGASWPVLLEAPMRSVVYYEILALLKTRAALAWDNAKAWLHSHPPTEICRPGMSPHAPYSARKELFAAVSLLGVPVAVHLAETRAERQLLGDHYGPFIGFLQELNSWEPDALIGDFDELLRLFNGLVPVALAHGNYLDHDAPMPPNATIVYCPRTHAAFGHPPHAFHEFLKRGVRVALGTDSLASNPDLSVLAEARFVHQRHPDVPGDVLLRMATLAGAEALGWADETGSLQAGKSADVVVLHLSNEEHPDPHRLVLESDLPVRAALFRGQWVHGDYAGSISPAP